MKPNTKCEIGHDIYILGSNHTVLLRTSYKEVKIKLMSMPKIVLCECRKYKLE